jgi:hypothetical protein
MSYKQKLKLVQFKEQLEIKTHNQLVDDKIFLIDFGLICLIIIFIIGLFFR